MNWKVSLVVFLVSFISCNKADHIEIIKYGELPEDVKEVFVERYNYFEPNKLPPFVECIDLDDDCDCKAEQYKNFIITGNEIKISSCTKEHIIPMGYYERVFVLKGDTTYIPYSLYGGMITSGKPRSQHIKIDTIQFVKAYGGRYIPFIEKE